jgi:hypothetical protein
LLTWIHKANPSPRPWMCLRLFLNHSQNGYIQISDPLIVASNMSLCTMRSHFGYSSCFPLPIPRLLSNARFQKHPWNQSRNMPQFPILGGTLKTSKRSI